MWVVVTRAMWELVTLHPTGYLDGRAVRLLAKFLGLDGFRIVKHEDGLLVPCDAAMPISEECPMMMHDGYRRFKALIPLRGVPLVSLVRSSLMSGGTIRDILCLDVKMCLRLTSDSFLTNALF